jgi:hypothetical protein
MGCAYSPLRSSHEECKPLFEIRIHQSVRKENIEVSSTNSERDLITRLDLSKLEKRNTAFIKKEFTPGSFPNLKELDLGYNFWGTIGQGQKLIVALEKWGGCCRLLKLSLSNSDLLEPDLSRCNLSNLVSLDLSQNSLGESGLKKLSKMRFNCLEELNLEAAIIIMGDDSAKILARGNFPKLKILHLEFNMLTIIGAKKIARGNFHSLSELYLQGNPFNGKQQQAKALFNPRVNLYF